MDDSKEEWLKTCTLKSDQPVRDASCASLKEGTAQTGTHSLALALANKATGACATRAGSA